MWLIESPSIREATLDFSSSGQSKLKVSQLVSDDIVLMNALELIDWNSDRTQVQICDNCGTSGCNSGGWISLRKTVDLILLLPAFEAIDTDAWSDNEFAPPRYRNKVGTPYVFRSDYLDLRKTVSTLPKMDEITPLTLSEAARLAQTEVPFLIFGNPPSVDIEVGKKGLVVAASQGDASEQLNTVARLLRDLRSDPHPANLRRLDRSEEVVYLFLDADEFIDWPAFVMTPDGERLLLDGEFVIEPNPAT